MTEDQVLEVLHHLENANLIRLVNPIGDWYRCYCPIHNSGQEKKPSCGVALHDIYMEGQLRYPAGMFHCFTCGFAKNMPEGITEILSNRGVTRSGLDWIKEHVPGFDPSNVDFDYLISSELSGQLINKFAINYINSKISSESVRYVSEQELASYRLTVPYMYERKLTDEVIAKYDIGFDANFVPEGKKKPIPCITFPIRDLQGRTLGFCRRSIKGKFFYMDKNKEKSVYGLYELPNRAKSVVICESCFNALTAVTYGYNAVALLGTGTASEINQLRMLGAQEFVLCLDNDDAGHRGMKRLKNALSDIAIVWTMTIPPIEDPNTGEIKSRDVNDLTKEEFDFYYSQRE